MCGINMDLSPSHPSDLMFMPQNYKARIRSRFYPFTTRPAELRLQDGDNP